MGANTKIQWAHHTFNPWRGCVKVAAGCVNCYAESQSKRNPKTLGVWGPNGTRVVASEAMWRQPLKWDKAAACCCRAELSDYAHESGCPQIDRRRVFCGSLCDVFEDWRLPVVNSCGEQLFVHVNGTMDFYQHGRQANLDDVRARLFRLIDSTPNLDWLLLTKRPENVRGTLPIKTGRRDAIKDGRVNIEAWRRKNVWLGTSIACRDDLKNLSELRKCKDLAAKIFVSAEPLIEDLGNVDWSGIDWVIVGGESGPNARPCDIAWIRSIVRQCREAGVPVFVKQLGSDSFRVVRGGPAVIDGGVAIHSVSHEFTNKFRDPKCGDPAEWPEDVRVREVP